MLQQGAWFIVYYNDKKCSTKTLIIQSIMLINEFIFKHFKQNRIK